MFEAIKSSPSLTVGAWNTLEFSDGSSEKFRSADWAEKMKDTKFRERVFELLNEEVILKFDKREGPASQFYENTDEDLTESDEAH